MFVLNREHVAAEPVIGLASLRARLWHRIAEHAHGWTSRPEAIVVYGSAARGDGGVASDIDLLVVRPSHVDREDDRWQDSITELAGRVAAWAGNPCEVLDRSASELRCMAADGERLLAEIRRDGMAVLGSMSVVPAPRAA